MADNTYCGKIRLQERYNGRFLFYRVTVFYVMFRIRIYAFNQRTVRFIEEVLQMENNIHSCRMDVVLLNIASVFIYNKHVRKKTELREQHILLADIFQS